MNVGARADQNCHGLALSTGTRKTTAGLGGKVGGAFRTGRPASGSAVGPVAVREPVAAPIRIRSATSIFEPAATPATFRRTLFATAQRFATATGFVEFPIAVRDPAAAPTFLTPATVPPVALLGLTPATAPVPPVVTPITAARSQPVVHPHMLAAAPTPPRAIRPRSPDPRRPFTLAA